MARKRNAGAPAEGRDASVQAMEKAVAAFLTGAGLDPRRHPDLGQTPGLVARAWFDEFLDGYRTEPGDILARRIEVGASREHEMVCLSHLSFVSVCPHHLLPYGGVAHVAYVPGRYVAGFGHIVELIDCLGHRLVLQEDLARQLARELQSGLKAKGAAVMLEARQSCMTLRGGCQAQSRVVTEAFAGSVEQQRELRERFRAAIRSAD